MSINVDHIAFAGPGSVVAGSLTETVLRTTLDMLPIGILLVDGGARIVHSNATARSMLGAGDPIVAHHGQLRARCATTTAALMSAARDVTHGDERPYATGMRVPLSCRDGRAAVAHIQPLCFESFHSGGEAAPTAAIFVTEAFDQAPPPTDALMILFSLTRSEGRVLEHIVSGKNRRETAAALGVADSTAKTHLDRIYAKTGTTDQLSLCRLVAALSWPALISQ